VQPELENEFSKCNLLSSLSSLGKSFLDIISAWFLGRGNVFPDFLEIQSLPINLNSSFLFVLFSFIIGFDIFS
jgi:hypothetical protein